MNMWNPTTRRVMYRLMRRHGIPEYKHWKGVMYPSLPGLVGKDFDRALGRVARDLNLLCNNFLTRGKYYKETSVKQQIAFTLQQGIRAKGYQHRFGGRESSCFGNLQAAIVEGFITFEEVHSTMHPFIISAASNIAFSELEKQLSEKSPEENAREAQLALDSVEAGTPPVLEDEMIFTEPASRPDALAAFLDAVRPYVSWQKRHNRNGDGHRLDDPAFIALWQSSSTPEEVEIKYNALIDDTVRQLKGFSVKKGHFRPYTWKYVRLKATRIGGLRYIPSPAKIEKMNRYQELICGDIMKRGNLVGEKWRQVEEKMDLWKTLGLKE